MEETEQSPSAGLEINPKQQETKEESSSDDDDILISYFLKSSPLFAQLQDFKKKARIRKDVKDYFQRKLDEKSQNRKAFAIDKKVMEEIDQTTNLILNSSLRTFLEVGCGTGGFSSYILSSKPTSRGIGIALPDASRKLLIPKSEKRYRFANVDFTQKLPPLKSQYDLVILNTWDEKTNETNMKQLLLSQLTTAFNHLTVTGNLLIKLSKKEIEFVASLIHSMEENFEKIQLLKPKTLGTELSTFYLLCFNLKSKDLFEHVQDLWVDIKEGNDIDAFNLDSQWLVDNYGKLLIAKYTPLWESQYNSLVKRFGLEEQTSETPTTSTFNSSSTAVIGQNFTYKSDLDENGVIFHLVNGNEKTVSVTSSSSGVGVPGNFISRERVTNWTLNQKYSWYCVDLGADNKVIPSHYTLGYASPGSACSPLYWMLQGSNQITRSSPYTATEKPLNDTDWKTLAIHNNDSSLRSDWAIKTWKLTTRQSYRYFRVIQTGPNAYQPVDETDTWSQVLAVNRFEVYGTLLPSNAANLPGLSSPPVIYGSATTPAPAPATLIKADPLQSRELQDIIVYFAKQQNNEGKPDKVRVHEIVL